MNRAELAALIAKTLERARRARMLDEDAALADMLARDIEAAVRAEKRERPR